MKKSSKIWVKINKGCMKNDKDANILCNLQGKYHANFNMHSSCAMWFDFKQDKDAFNFARAVTNSFPYLSVTTGTGEIDP